MFNPFKKTYTLVTHSGKFHADDIFACAILQLVLDKEGKQYKVIRTRDPAIIEKGDYVFDVGGIHDSQTKRFDHHQKGGAGNRLNAIPYAACGLVWKEYGLSLVNNKDLVGVIDEKIIQPIDAHDNGISLLEVKNNIRPYMIQDAFGVFVATPEEGEQLNNIHFNQLVLFAKKIITREIQDAQFILKSQDDVISVYQNATDKRLIVLNENIPATDVLMKYPEPLYIMIPNTDGMSRIVGVSLSKFSFERRKPFPKAWAGLRDQDLVRVTGVDDAVFCHNALFLVVAKSKEGALKLAQLALDNKD